MKILKEQQLGFDDITIIPDQVSEIESRQEIFAEVKLSHVELCVPIIAAPMVDVCDGNVAEKMRELGGFGFVHRFCSIDEQVEQTNYNCGAAIGLNDLERYNRLCLAGRQLFCIDVANGANKNVEKALQVYAYNNPLSKFVIGNVASAETYKWCASLPNVVGVRCGISGGRACTTKNATAVNSPMISLLMECREVKKDGWPLIIADGGIREPSDFCKAMACGADAIMLGSLIAATTNSPAKIIVNDNGVFKEFSGSASFHVQSSYKETPKYIEGRTLLLPYKNESLEQLIEKFMDGLRSSMSYCNARSLNEYRENVAIGILK